LEEAVLDKSFLERNKYQHLRKLLDTINYLFTVNQIIEKIELNVF